MVFRVFIDRILFHGRQR